MKAISILIILLGTNYMLTGYTDPHWKVRLQKENFQIAFKEQENEKFNIYRVEGCFTSSLADVEKIVDQISLFQDWFPACESAKVVKEENEFPIVHLFMDFPFPFRDRDVFIKIRKEKLKDRIIYHVHHVDELAEIHENYVRMTQFTGTFTLFTQNSTVMFRQEIYIDPSGNINRTAMHADLPRRLHKSFTLLEKMVNNG